MSKASRVIIKNSVVNPENRLFFPKSVPLCSPNASVGRTGLWPARPRPLKSVPGTNDYSCSSPCCQVGDGSNLDAAWERQAHDDDAMVKRESEKQLDAAAVLRWFSSRPG